MITDVKQIVLENGLVDETWTLIPTKDENAQELNNAFTFKGWEDEDVNLSEALSAARTFYTLYSVKEIGEVEDLSEYGLNGDGTIKAEVEYLDGTKDTIIVGSAAGESSGRYALIDGKVYIAAFSEVLAQKQYMRLLVTAEHMWPTRNRSGGSERQQGTRNGFFCQMWIRSLPCGRR